MGSDLTPLSDKNMVYTVRSGGNDTTIGPCVQTACRNPDQ